MALQACKVNGRDGFKHGDGGTCFTHDGTKRKQRVARYKAITQGLKVGKSASLFQEDLDELALRGMDPRRAETRGDA